VKAKTWNLNVLCIIFSQVIRKKEHNTVNIMHPPKSIHFFISMTLLISLLLFLVWHCLHFYQLLVFVLIHFARQVQEKMIRHYLQNYITVSQLKPVLIWVLTGFIKWGNKVKNLDIPSLRSCMSLFFTCISLLINRSQLIKTVFLRNLYQISYIMSYYPNQLENRLSKKQYYLFRKITS
jgi:hypothetical protein